MADGGTWAITPRRVLIAFVTILVIGFILSPNAVPDSGGLLTTYASDDGGARGFFEATRRLGWRPSRHLDRLSGPLDTAAIYAILRPPVPMTSGEVSAVLAAVRGGAGLLLVPGFRSPFADSLGIELAPAPPLGVTRADPAAWDSVGLLPTPRWPLLVLRLTADRPPMVDTILAVHGIELEPDSLHPVVVAFPYGRGRVVMLSHGTLLSNTMLRERRNAVLPIRMLEWLAPGRRPEIVFTEYHQGHGQHASVMGTVRRELFTTPGGRAVLHLLAAAGVLLLAMGIRPIAPHARTRIERRSPLEHVGALAHAYSQVNATRTALRHLVRGLRRRHPIGMLRSASDEQYLLALAARHPAVAAEVDTLVKLIDDRPTPDRFAAGGAAIAHIERTLGT